MTIAPSESVCIVSNNVSDADKIAGPDNVLNIIMLVSAMRNRKKINLVGFHKKIQSIVLI